jgi:hypothetical protein
MRHARTAAAAVAATALTGLAPGLAAAQTVKIEDAVARVVVIVENRADIGVEIDSPAGTPVPVRLERRGPDVIIRGDVEGRDLRECRGGRDAVQPGQGASVTLRRTGEVALETAPLIVVRTPGDVRVEADGAVYGAIGRGASSVRLANAGCGRWTVADVDGDLRASLAGSGGLSAGRVGRLDLQQAGSGAVTVGASNSAAIALAGSGDIRVGPVSGDASASMPGSGDVVFASVGGRVEANIVGSGDVRVVGGRSAGLEANIVGSGDVRHGGEAGAVHANIVGSGDVIVARAAGEVRRRILGSGEVRIGD